MRSAIRPLFTSYTYSALRPAALLLPPILTRTPRSQSRLIATQSRTMAATDSTLKAFFQSPKYAVVGASTNTQKYGYKVFRWYVNHDLEATPINPTAKEIDVDGVKHATKSSLSQLESPTETSVSFITPPSVTLKALGEAKELGVPSVFLQPGTFNDEVLAFARDNFQAVVAGDGGRGPEGWCVLVDGERGLKAAGKL